MYKLVVNDDMWLSVFKNWFEYVPEGGKDRDMQIIFDTSKQELGNPGSNFKKFVKKYKEQNKV